jgi:hypothetical protein
MNLPGDHTITETKHLGGCFALEEKAVVSRHPSVAIDFESYYDKDISVTTMGAWHYARATDIYMVAMYFDDGTCFVGEPVDAPWPRCIHRDWIMHNAAFDLTLLQGLIENGTVPPVTPRFVFDTADLASYLSYPRSLKEAAHHLLGMEMSKTTRNNMKGLKWSRP